MRRLQRFAPAALVLALLLCGAGPATQPVGLKVDVEGGKSIVLSPEAFAKLPHEQVKATEHGGGTATYSGVPLGKVLEAVEAPLGEKLRGPNMALYVVAEGVDGYKAVFSLTEADPAFGDRHILVADRREGAPLPAGSAPFKIVAPQDAKQGRWVRMLAAIHVRRAG